MQNQSESIRAYMFSVRSSMITGELELCINYMRMYTHMLQQQDIGAARWLNIFVKKRQK